MSQSLSTNRLNSADVYRGFVMFLMMAEVLSFEKVSEALPESPFWKILAFNQSHVEWIGCSLHDLIQPSFSFLVGVVLPYSVANRLQHKENFMKVFSHVMWRSLKLILLGIFLRSQWKEQTNFTFEDTLTQIGLGYSFLFLLNFRSQKIQITALIIILLGYWMAFALYPLPEANFDTSTVGVAKDWSHHLMGFMAHWNKNTNLASDFDEWFLNLFPREKSFVFNGGGYVTLSFIPTLGTMILGLLAGNILKSTTTANQKIKTFLILGLGGLALGLLINGLGICPNVKRIWTPTWVIFSGGWCFLLMAFFYWTIDVHKKGNYAYFFLVIGTNSIAAYIIAHTVDSYIARSLFIHLGKDYTIILGTPYKTLVQGVLILVFEWLILRWMYQKRIFIKV